MVANAGVWVALCFYAGGEIWIIARSVLVRDADGVFAIATTDLLVEAPAL